jgi:hypothetical protein
VCAPRHASSSRRIDIVDFTCRITRGAAADLQVDLTVRNTSTDRPQHALQTSLVVPPARRQRQGLLARHDGQDVPVTAGHRLPA